MSENHRDSKRTISSVETVANVDDSVADDRESECDKSHSIEVLKVHSNCVEMDASDLRALHTYLKNAVHVVNKTKKNGRPFNNVIIKKNLLNAFAIVNKKMKNVSPCNNYPKMPKRKYEQITKKKIISDNASKSRKNVSKKP